MHIAKSFLDFLWKVIDGRNNKEKIYKVISDIEEANIMQHLTHFYGNGQQTRLPWLLVEKQSVVVKEVIHKIKFPTSFSSNLPINYHY